MMNNKNKAIILSLLIVVIAGYLIFLRPGEQGNYDAFAKCLTEKGISMGGTDWCPHCKEQKKRFGSSFAYIDYHNCDNEREWCRSNGVKGYPTWVFPDGRLVAGTQRLKSLSTLSGCELSK